MELDGGAWFLHRTFHLDPGRFRVVGSPRVSFGIHFKSPVTFFAQTFARTRLSVFQHLASLHKRYVMSFSLAKRLHDPPAILDTSSPVWLFMHAFTVPVDTLGFTNVQKVRRSEQMYFCNTHCIHNVCQKETQHGFLH